MLEKICAAIVENKEKIIVSWSLNTESQNIVERFLPLDNYYIRKVK